MSTTEKDRMANGTDFQEIVDDFRQRQQPKQSLNEDISSTPKRPSDDTDIDIQEIDDNTFQMVNKNKKTRPQVNLNGQNRNTSDYQGVSHQGQQEHQHNRRRENSGGGFIIFNSQNARRAKE